MSTIQHKEAGEKGKKKNIVKLTRNSDENLVLPEHSSTIVASTGDLRQYFQERMGWILITTIQMKITFN